MKPLLAPLIATVVLSSACLAYPTARGNAQDVSPVAASDSRAGVRGSKIAFSRLRHGPDSNEFLETEIWVMGGDGTEPRQVTHNTTWDLSPAWSPDGKTIAFYATQFDALGQQPIAPAHVHLVDADGSDERLLTNMPARFPSWSPNGKIAFDSGGPSSSDIFVINPDGSGLQQLTSDPAARNIRPDWSPDGHRIAFTSRRDGNDEIYLMNADGTEATRLTFEPAPDNAPAWSPNGQRIVFQRTLAGGNTELYTINADGTDQTRLTDYPGRDQDPDWSPNGRKIAFQRDIEPIAATILQVFTMNADSSQKTPLTTLPSENGHPGWGRGHATEP